MNEYFITITPEKTKEYPLHQHNYWEIMYYLDGEGYLATAGEGIPFRKGSIIIVPPKTMHGSVSRDGFVNISIGGSFQHFFLQEMTIKMRDNTAGEGEMLSRLIFRNRYANTDYLSALCGAYLRFLLQNMRYESNIHRTVTEIVAGLTENFSDPNLDITDLLRKSGYAEDYIRAEFKKITSMTPVQFLRKLRIDHARKLLEIYGKNITVAETAAACGFEDCVYFSKRFKQWTGVSPDRYRREVIKDDENLM